MTTLITALAALVLVMVWFAAGYHSGSKDMQATLQAEQINVLRNAIIDSYRLAKDQAAADHQAQAGFERVRESVRTVYIKVKEKANENIEYNPRYDHCSLDADGLRLYNARPTSTSSSPAPSLADISLPGFADCCGWTAGDPTQEQH